MRTGRRDRHRRPRFGRPGWRRRDRAQQFKCLADARRPDHGESGGVADHPESALIRLGSVGGVVFCPGGDRGHVDRKRAGGAGRQRSPPKIKEGIARRGVPGSAASAADSGGVGHLHPGRHGVAKTNAGQSNRRVRVREREAKSRNAAHRNARGREALGDDRRTGDGKCGRVAGGARASVGRTDRAGGVVLHAACGGGHAHRKRARSSRRNRPSRQTHGGRAGRSGECSAARVGGARTACNLHARRQRIAKTDPRQRRT